ncbi:MAG TPA: hypothetical protein PLD99_01225 [Parcubacteria group bacterium]|nr:hypothetical protein [Parcubacteria group bacterium]
MQNLRTLIIEFGNLVELAIPIVAGLALLGFFWGLAKYIFSQGNEQSKIEGKKVMVYGLVALFVMFSVWGIIGFFQRDLNIDPGAGIIQIQTI